MSEANDESQPFNLALFPEEKQFIAQCIKLAQGSFSLQTEEYLLGDDITYNIMSI